MKKIISIVFFICLSILGKSQEFTIFVAPTVNNLYYYNFVKGGSSGNYKLGIYASFEYFRSKERIVTWGYGLSLQRSNVEIVPSPLNVETHIENFNLISGNLKVLFNLPDEYYLSVDPFIDLQLKSNTQISHYDQTGLGLSLGLGKRLLIREAISIKIEPRMWVHNIVPFVDKNLPKRLTVFGIKAGFTL